jgi:hypothetical protein
MSRCPFSTLGKRSRTVPLDSDAPSCGSPSSLAGFSQPRLLRRLRGISVEVSVHRKRCRPAVTATTSPNSHPCRSSSYQYGGRDSRPRRKPVSLLTEHDHDDYRQQVTAADIIAHRSVEHGSRLSKYRWSSSDPSRYSTDFGDYTSLGDPRRHPRAFPRWFALLPASTHLSTSAKTRVVALFACLRGSAVALTVSRKYAGFSVARSSIGALGARQQRNGLECTRTQGRTRRSTSSWKLDLVFSYYAWSNQVGGGCRVRTCVACATDLQRHPAVKIKMVLELHVLGPT